MGSSTVRLLAAHALVAVRAPVEARVARRCCALYRRRRLHVAPRAAAEDQRGGEFVAQTQSPPMLRSPGAAKRRFFAMRRTRPYGISSAWDRCCLAPKATLLRQVCRRTGTHSSPPRTEKNYLNQCANAGRVPATAGSIKSQVNYSQRMMQCKTVCVFGTSPGGESSF